MSINYPKIVTQETQNKVINERITRYTEQLRVINIVLKVLPKYEGKKITAHIATAIQKELPEKYIFLDKSCGMYHLKINPQNNYSEWDKISILLGYARQSRFGEGDIIKVESIKEHNKCYTLNEERLPKLQEGLKHIKELVTKRNKAIELLQTINKEACKYEMDYDFDIDV